MLTTDVIIIGAGPIGIELAALLKKSGADYLHIEARQIGHTISQWPRDTQFFSAPERVALAGVPVHSPNQQSLTGEMYLSYLRGIVELLDLEIQTFEPVTHVSQLDDRSFTINTQSVRGKQTYRCNRLVIATGNMSTPRTLGIDGEEMAHVDHALLDPHKYFRKRLLIVGGKNSALEAALRCWRAGASVTLSYRQDKFEESIVKPHLAREIRLLIAKGMIDFYPQTTPIQIEADHACLQHTGDIGIADETTNVLVDFVLFCIGYEMDMSLFTQLDVQLCGEERIPEFNEETMETNVPNLYVAGTAAGGMQHRHELFIITCHEHAEKIAHTLTGQRPSITGALAQRNYAVTFDDVQED